MAIPRTRFLALGGAAAGALALAIALFAQHVLGLIPCALCYLERWPYRIAIGVGLLAAILPRHPARAACWLLVACFIGAASIAFVHVGVEQRWWKSPLPECSVPDLSAFSAAERFAHMPDRPSKPCEDPDYLIPAIPISMTQANMAYALAAAALLAISLLRTPRRQR